MELTILGSSSAIPIIERNPTSQFLHLAGRYFLIDCGEGTQVQLRKNQIGFGRVDHILISHLHGDHFFGLVPLLQSLQLLDRHKPIHIYGPPGLKDIIDVQLRASYTKLRYELNFHPLDMKEPATVFEDENVVVTSFPLKHGIDCCGFYFRERERPRKMSKEALAKYSIPVSEIKKIKLGEDWVDEDGKVIPNAELTYEAPPPLSYAFCTDTLPLELSRYFTKPSLLYHEATFREEHSDRAKKTNHSTAPQAAGVARSVEAENLIVGHFSIRYKDAELEELLQEAKEGFENTFLAREGMCFTVDEKGLKMK